MSLIQQNMGAIYDGSQRLIAPVLNSTTATQNWAVGQEFILDGNLYKVTIAIPSGSQIIVSGSSANCALADTVTEQINTVENQIATQVPATQPINSTGGTGTIYVSKSGNVVNIKLQGSFSNINRYRTGGSNYIKLCDLPVGFRPSASFYIEGSSFFSNEPYYIISVSSAGVYAQYRNDSETITERNLSIYQSFSFIM